MPTGEIDRSETREEHWRTADPTSPARECVRLVHLPTNIVATAVSDRIREPESARGLIQLREDAHRLLAELVHEHQGGSLPTIRRPNGKVYRPRKIVVEPWENDDYLAEYSVGVLVFGTHDIDRARPLANDFIKSQWGNELWAMNPFRTWVRNGFADGGTARFHDEERGRACVQFDAGEE